MGHKTVIREVKPGLFFVDRGTVQPIKFGKLADGKVGVLPREHVYDGSTGIGYYDLDKAKSVAADWFEPVDIVIEMIKKVA